MAELSELRRRLGGNLSDEEFLLRATMPAEQVDAMRAAGPAAQAYDASSAGVMRKLRALLARTDLAAASISSPGFHVELA